MFNPAKLFFNWIAFRLAELQLIDKYRGTRIAGLTWPRFLTMFARNSRRVADLAMIGLAVGPTAIAGIAFATIYWGVGNGFSLGLAGGTISQVSQRFGSDQHGRIDLVIKQSVWFGIALALPFTLIYWLFAEPLIAAFAADDATITHGTVYLSILSWAMLFNFLNTISSRVLAGADDTWIAMSVRAIGAFANVILNMILIFELGLGVAGAAWGTVIAESLVTGCFVVGFVFGRLPVIGQFPVSVSLDFPYFDMKISKQLLIIITPLIVRKLAHSVAKIPLFAMLALFGPIVVASFEVGRRVQGLMGTPASGFSMAASSLVGQELGQGDEQEADYYAWDTIYFSASIYIITASFVFLFARQLAPFFVDDPTTISQTVPFIQTAAISLVGYGLDRTFMGILKAAGDNRWSMYGGFAGKYLALLPITYLGLITPLGVIAVYLAMIVETWLMAGMTGYRVFSGVWKEIARSYRPEVSTD